MDSAQWTASQTTDSRHLTADRGLPTVNISYPAKRNDPTLSLSTISFWQNWNFKRAQWCEVSYMPDCRQLATENWKLAQT